MPMPTLLLCPSLTFVIVIDGGGGGGRWWLVGRVIIVNVNSDVAE
jgi:hypothetical protein